jgi:hypothetical protein
LSDNYLCYCQRMKTNQTECLSYQQQHTTCKHCLNRGYCIRGDIQNASDFACVCPLCVSGTLCQFSMKRFSISFEFLVQKIQWGQFHFIGPILFTIIGAILNGLGVIIFAHPKTRHTGVSIYLLVDSMISQSVLILLCARVIYLHLARHISIRLEISQGLCISLPLMMLSLYCISLWLTAFVTIQRMLVVTRLDHRLACHRSSSASLLILLASIAIFGCNYFYTSDYRLVNHPDERFPWCVQEMQSNEPSFMRYFSLALQVIPFMINVTGGAIIILVVSYSKANAHKLTTRSAVAQQIWQRLDLLLGPCISFLTQTPQMIILFLNPCDFDGSEWFSYVTLVTYYISFTPQVSLFFLYVSPSPLYNTIFRTETCVGRYLSKIAS